MALNLNQWSVTSFFSIFSCWQLIQNSAPLWQPNTWAFNYSLGCQILKKKVSILLAFWKQQRFTQFVSSAATALNSHFHHTFSSMSKDIQSSSWHDRKWYRQAAVDYWVSLCVWSIVGLLIVYQDGNYLYPGQYSQTICWLQIRWYSLWGGNILLVRPSTFLESRSWSWHWKISLFTG